MNGTGRPYENSTIVVAPLQKTRYSPQMIGLQVNRYHSGLASGHNRANTRRPPQA